MQGRANSAYRQWRRCLDRRSSGLASPVKVPPRPSPSHDTDSDQATVPAERGATVGAAAARPPGPAQRWRTPRSTSRGLAETSRPTAGTAGPNSGSPAAEGASIRAEIALVNMDGWYCSAALGSEIRQPATCRPWRGPRTAVGRRVPTPRRGRVAAERHLGGRGQQQGTNGASAPARPTGNPGPGRATTMGLPPSAHAGVQLDEQYGKAAAANPASPPAERALGRRRRGPTGLRRRCEAPAAASISPVARPDAGIASGRRKLRPMEGKRRRGRPPRRRS